MICYNGDSFDLNLYDLKSAQDEDSICECENQDDEYVKLIKNEQKGSFFGRLFKKITNVLHYIIPIDDIL